MNGATSAKDSTEWAPRRRVFAEFSWPVLRRGQQSGSLDARPEHKLCHAEPLAGTDRGCCAESKRQSQYAFLEEPAIEPMAIQRPVLGAMRMCKPGIGFDRTTPGRSARSR